MTTFARRLILLALGMLAGLPPWPAAELILFPGRIPLVPRFSAVLGAVTGALMGAFFGAAEGITSRVKSRIPSGCPGRRSWAASAAGAVSWRARPPCG